MGDNGNGKTLVGAELEGHIGGLFADIKAGIGKMNGFLDKLSKEWGYQRKGPTQVNMDASATAASTFVPLWLDLGGPAYGRMWEVRQILWSSNYISQAVAGSIEIVIASNLIIGEPPAAWLQDFYNPTTPIPGRAFYSAGQFRVRHPNHVYVVVVGGAGSGIYQATGDALDMPDEATRRVVEI